jgi:hypothetical protein
MNAVSVKNDEMTTVAGGADDYGLGKALQIALLGAISLAAAAIVIALCWRGTLHLGPSFNEGWYAGAHRGADGS